MRLNRGVFLSHLCVWLLWQTGLCHRECVLSWHTRHSGHTVSVSSSWLEESLWEACGGQPGRRPRLRDCLNPPVLRSHICPVLSPVQIYISLNVHKYTNIQINTNKYKQLRDWSNPPVPLIPAQTSVLWDANISLNIHKTKFRSISANKAPYIKIAIIESIHLKRLSKLLKGVP